MSDPPHRFRTRWAVSRAVAALGADAFIQPGRDLPLPLQRRVLVDQGSPLRGLAGNHRYNQLLPTLITTNPPVAELRDAVGDRVASRLTEMTDRVILTGHDHRRRTAG